MGGPLYAGNTLYIDSTAHHLSDGAQNPPRIFLYWSGGCYRARVGARALPARHL